MFATSLNHYALIWDGQRTPSSQSKYFGFFRGLHFCLLCKVILQLKCLPWAKCMSCVCVCHYNGFVCLALQSRAWWGGISGHYNNRQTMHMTREVGLKLFFIFLQINCKCFPSQSVLCMRAFTLEVVIFERKSYVTTQGAWILLTLNTNLVPLWGLSLLQEQWMFSLFHVPLWISQNSKGHVYAQLIGSFLISLQLVGHFGILATKTDRNATEAYKVAQDPNSRGTSDEWAGMSLFVFAVKESYRKPACAGEGAVSWPPHLNKLPSVMSG